MKPKFSVTAFLARLCATALCGTLALGGQQLSAQSSVDGSWNANGGSWGNFTLTASPWSFSQSMRPAVVTALLNPGATASLARSGGVITSITLTNPGSGYTKRPTVIINGGGGTGARAYANINQDGEVTGIVLVSGGSGYNSPTAPTVVISREIAGFTMTDRGSGYSFPPRVSFSGGGGYTSVPTVAFAGGNGTGATATAVRTGTSVTSISIGAGGSGYGVAPRVNITGGGGTGAAAVANVTGGVVTSIEVINQGSGYSSTPTISFSTDVATGTAVIEEGRLTGIEINNPGTGYTSAPQVNISGGGAVGNGGSYMEALIEGDGVVGVSIPGDSGNPAVTLPLGGASGAEAVATLNPDGSIATFNLVDGGQGFTSAPTVLIGVPFVRTATAISSRSGNSVSAITVTNPGAGYLSAPSVTVGTNGWQGYTSAPQVRFSFSGVTGAIATATRTGSGISSVTVNYGGAGYSQASPPTVSFIGGGGSGAAGTAVVNAAGAVVGVNITNQGTGYNSTPIVAFAVGGVRHARATATVSGGRLVGINVTHAGTGYTSNPTITFSGGIANGGSHALATAVLGGTSLSSVTINSPGGAVQATAVAVRALNGTISSVVVTNGGSGYTTNPSITLAAPGGVATPTQLGPGGVGSYVHFNNNITGNSTITLDAARVVGSLSIGDWQFAEDYTLTAGTGGVANTLTFDMGLQGGGQSFLQKLQGDQDVISAPIVLNNQLNARINAGRLTLNGGISGTGSLVTSGNGVMTITGAAEGSLTDLWLWHRSTGNSGAQVELGTVGGPAFGSVRIGNASAGTVGFAVLQLLEGRGANQLDQIADNATIIADAVTNRWAYFKLMGGNETVGNILDNGNALVLENMEGETVNTDAVLTLGGNNLNSYIGGFVRNRGSGSGTGTLGITKEGTGNLTLFGGNVNYTGPTVVNGGELRLINTTTFASPIQAAAGTSIVLDATGSTSFGFDDPITGSASITKLGTGSVTFTGGQTNLDNLAVKAGNVSFLPGAATLRGGRNTIQNDFTAISVPGLSRSVFVGGSLSVGSMRIDGLYGTIGSFLALTGGVLSQNNVGTYVDGVLESRGQVILANTELRLNGGLFNQTRQVTNTSTNSLFISVSSVSNIIPGSVVTLASGVAPAANRKIQPDTRVVAVNLVTNVVEVSRVVNIVAGTDINFTFSNQTDGVLRGESLDFADVTYDGRKFVAVTRAGTIHTSLNGTRWAQVYQDPASVPFSSITWTGGLLVVVGEQGRVATSADGQTWTQQNSGTSNSLNGVTNTAVAFTGVTTVGGSTVTNVTNAAQFAVGSPVFGFATPPDARILSALVNGSAVTLTLDSNALHTATDVDFGYFRGNTTAGSPTITNVRTAQTLVAGIPVSGTGIQASSVINLVDGPNSRLTLDRPASLGASGVALFTLEGNTTLGSPTVSGLTNTHGLVVGMTLRGNSVAPGSTITAINAGAGTLTLSRPAVATLNGVPLSIFTVRTVTGSAVLEDVTAASSYNLDMPAGGVTIPQGTFVTATTANTLTLSQPARSTTVAATPAALVGSRTLVRLTGTFTAGSKSVTSVSSTTGLVVGLPVVAPGLLPAGTVIEAVPGSGTLTLSHEALAPGAPAQFLAGFDLVAVGAGGTILAAAGGTTGSWAAVPNPATSAATLNSVAWSPTSVLLAVAGSNGLLMRSTNGMTWTRQTPPLADAENVITGVNVADRQITLNNNAASAASNVSFAAFKGSTSVGSPTVSSISGMGVLRVGMLVTTPTGFQPGTSVLSVNEGAFSMVLSTTATATISQAPLQTFSGLVVNGSNVITEVTDFKGLMPGMSLHGAALASPVTIIALDRAARTITVAAPFTQRTRSGFGVLYGDITTNSANVTSIRITSSGQTLSGASGHLTAGRGVADVAGIIPAGTTISAFSATANTVTLSASATGSGFVPLLSFTGTTTNGSNVITNVPAASLTGVSTGMQIYVTGTADTTASWANNTFTITSIATTSGVSSITLSAAPALNPTGDPTVVAMGVFTGLATSGQNLIRSISNRLGELPPVLYLPEMRKVAWLGSQFVAAGDFGALMTSPDGNAWTTRDSTTARDLHALAQVGTRLFAAGENGIILSSTNSGASWTAVRPADSPALNDFRAIETLKAVLAGPGRVIAYGNGGLASTDAAGASWSSSLSDSFSGTTNTLTIAGRVGGAGAVTIVNDFQTSATTDPAGGVLVNRNNTNRIGDSVTLESMGGAFEFRVNTADVAFSESIAGLRLSQGQMQMRTFRAGANGTSTLTFGSLENRPGATIDFLGLQNNSGSLSVVTGSIGENTRNRILFTAPPTLDDGILGGWATIDNEWATYGTNGVTRLAAAAYNTGDQTGWAASNNVKMQAARTLGGARVINSLNMQGQTLNLNGQRLSIESGGLLVHTGTALIQGNSSNQIGGSLTVGAGVDQASVLNIINSTQLTLNTVVTDFVADITTGAAANDGDVTVTLGNLSGLTAGMEVAVKDTALPEAASIQPGTRILSIDATNSRVTLSVPLKRNPLLPPTVLPAGVAIRSGTMLTFRGGAVSMAKSGGGLLILGGNNTYSGRTYINNGTVRALSTGAFGNAPSSFVPDQIQINGGTLQMSHVVIGTAPLADYNVNFNDGRTGITVGAAGGGIEVGSANPNNNGATPVPIINLVITNPINAIGAMELRVRSNTSISPVQLNSLTIGTSTSANVFRAGLKTETGFEGIINFLGNNTIGGFYNEGGQVLFEGNNNFTAPINNRLGTVTLRGSNTWNGGATFTEPLVIAGGQVNLATPGAWGTGGLNLELTAGTLNIMGVSQTIKLITSGSTSVIINTDVPDNITGATSLVFDLDRGQTFAGSILDGLNVSRDRDAAIKLVKKGPGTLTLTSSQSTFSGGVEIQEGAINVVTFGSTSDQRSSLGTVASDAPSRLIIDKGVLSFSPSFAIRSDRSFTMGAGPNGATLVANGASRAAAVTLGVENRDLISGTTSITTPVAFKDAGPRTLTLSGTGIGDNRFLIELQDSAPGAPSSIFKASSGRWQLGKAAPYTGLTTVQEGTLAVTKNDVLGTAGMPTTVSSSAFSGNLPPGTPVSFPLFATTTLPGGLRADTQYYVVESTGTSFKVATTPGGTPLTLTTNGANVQVVAKIDNNRSTSYDLASNTFTGRLPNGAAVTFNTKAVAGVTNPVVPEGMVLRSTYYVVSSDGSTFQLAETPGGPPVVFTSAGTANTLYYVINASGSTAAGVNLVGGSLELKDVNYLTPETLMFEGGALTVPALSRSSWAGDLNVNAPSSRIVVGTGANLTLSGNILGYHGVNQEGEGTVRLTGEALAPFTGANGNREWAVRAGTLVLDYSLNNFSKLVDAAPLRLGGSRRGGTVILSGGSHEEIVSQTILEAGASKIYRQDGSSVLRLNSFNRLTGSTLYLDGGRIAKSDQVNNSNGLLGAPGIMGAWAIIRDAITNAYWVIPGTTEFTYAATADADNDYITTNSGHVITRGSVVTFTSTGALPGGLQAGVPYYAIDSDGSARIFRVSTALNGSRVNITSAGTGDLTVLREQGFQANAATDLLTTVDAHGLADGVRVRLRSYGVLPVPLQADTDYFVVRAQSRSFRLSTTLGGPPLSISNNGAGAHVVVSQGVERRAGPTALTFQVNPDFLPASDGNGRVRVAIQHSPVDGPITSALTGQGTVGNPYIYTVTTTPRGIPVDIDLPAPDTNSTLAIINYVNNDVVGGQPVSEILRAVQSPSVGSGTLFPAYARMADPGQYGAPTELGNGTYDDGRQDLSWARNAGVPGSPGTLDDGFIMPYDTYSSGWDSNINTDVVADIGLAAIRNTFSVRFASQAANTVTLLNSGINAIRTGGILVSPSVGANDSTITGTGRLTTENQGNLQNMLFQQHNTSGSLIVNNVITDRAAIDRTAWLTADFRRYLYLSDISGISPGWTVSGAGITAGSIVMEVDAVENRVALDRNTDNTYRTGITYTFTSPDAATTLEKNGTYSNPGRRILAGILNPSDPTKTGTEGLTVGMSVSGAGITAPTTIEQIIDGHSVKLSRDHDGGFRRADYIFAINTPASTVRRASTGNADRRIVIGVVRPVAGISPPSMVSTADLYVGMPISGPGIPFGSTITFIYNESDIQVSTNHFFTGDRKNLRFTPSTGVEKLGAGTLALNGASNYTGVTFIADGTLRVGSLTDGGVAGSLGASSGASGNLVFNGGTLQYVGDSGQTNRGFTVAEFARINVGHERTSATFSGAISSGQDNLEKDGPGTLVLNGNANLAAFRVMQGRLLLQAVDTNPTPATFSPTNFSTGSLTQLILNGGTLEARGTPEGNVTQTLGTQLVVEAGASRIVATSVAGFDPNNLTIPTPGRNMVLNLMGQEELTSVVRRAGGTVHFLENAEAGGGAASIFLLTDANDRGFIMPWATYQSATDPRDGVNHFATIELTNGAVQSADVASLYSRGSRFLSPNGWDNVRDFARGTNPSEDSIREANGTFTGFGGNVSVNRFVNILRYENSAASNIIIDAARTFEIVNGAILIPTSVRGGAKAISGPGILTGGAQNDTSSDMILHNYNRAAHFTISATIADRSITAASKFNPALGRGSIRTGEVDMQINRTDLVMDFFTMVRPGMEVTGPGIQPGTVVVSSESEFRRVVLSLPALSNQTNQVYEFKDVVNLIQTGTGTTVLAGTNTYTGTTYVHGGVLRLDSAGAVPGGIGVTGGTSSIVVHGGVLGLGAGDFTRPVGPGLNAIRFTGSGGFAAYGADRVVNIGGAAVSEPLRFGNDGFVPDGASLVLGSHDATHKLIFANPIDLSAFSQAVRIQDGPAAVEAELAGGLSGLGRLVKFGLGTLRLGVSNANGGGIEVAEGRLIAANVPNVFGLSTGPLRLGTSQTNTTSGGAVDVEIEGGSIANRVEVGAVNSRGGDWVQGGVVDNPSPSANVGRELSAAIVDGYPAMAYYDATNGDLKYVRALDPRGSAWGRPVVVASRGNVGRNPSLAVINGNPAITFYDETAGLLLYSRASDAQGVVWGTPVSVLGQGVTVLTAVPLPGGKILVGGSFTRFYGAPARRLVRLNADGSLDDTFDANIMNGEVRAILPQDIDNNGTIDFIYAAGTFTQVRANKDATNDTARNRLVRLNPDGTLDNTLVPNVNGDIRFVEAQADGKILLGGSFTSVNGATRSRFARLNNNGVLDTSFGSPDIRNGEVRAIVPEDDNSDGVVDSYIIGGSFTDIGGVVRNRLARISATGARLGYNPDANNTVFDIVPQPGGRMLVAGAFTNFAAGVVARTRLARLNNDGSVDENFAQEVNNEVRDLHLQPDGRVVMAGVFTQVGDSQRSFIARLQADGSVEDAFNPDPDYEVRSITQLSDGSLLASGLFTQIASAGHQFVSRMLVTGAADPAYSQRNVLNWGRRSSLAFINGAPAVAFQDTAAADVYYLRSTDANGGGWGNPELVDSAGSLGANISLVMGNIGGDLLSKSGNGTTDTADDTIFISGTANIGTPLIVYSDDTNNSIRYVVGLNVNGNGLAAPLTNWTPPQVAAAGGAAHFNVGLVDKRPAIVWVDSASQSLRYIRAATPSGLTHNLRIQDTLETVTRLISDAVFTPAWSSPETLDSGVGIGEYPSLTMINGQPTTVKDRPAVSYYAAAQGDLRLVAAADDVGTVWNTPVTLASVNDVGSFANLMMTAAGLPGIAYYNATAQRPAFILASSASGYSRLTFSGATTLSGQLALSGAAMFTPQSGVTAQITGQISGESGFRLVGQGVLNILSAANTFGTSLSQPGVSTSQGTAVDGAVIIRGGTLMAGASGALGAGVVEMGDTVPSDLTVDRATTRSATHLGGTFSSLHDGLNATENSVGAFLDVSATIDGRYLGLFATTAEPGTDRFTGNIPNGTRVVFYFSSSPLGIEGGQVYFVRGSTGVNFQVSATQGGAAVNLQDTGRDVFYQLADSLDAVVLVKDEFDNPERNGVYRVRIKSDIFNREEGRINLGRVAAMDSVAEMRTGSVVRVQNGTSAGKAFFIASRVTDLNVSAAHFVEDVPDPAVSLLASAGGVTLGNGIDLNARTGAGAMTLGGAATLTAGTAVFTGAVTLQDIRAGVRETQVLNLASSTQTGLGVSLNGLISEANGGTSGATDMLSLVKTGTGIVTLGGNNTFRGGITINQGTLLVMNTPSGPTSSGTGTGAVQVNSGSVLGGTGTIGGAVTLAGTNGSPAVLRPGDPVSTSSPVEVLTLNQPLTVGVHSVVEFSIGVDNYTRLVGTGMSLTDASSRIVVALRDGYMPAAGTEFDLLDLTGPLNLFGGATNLLNLLMLPIEKVWDTTQFLTQGRIIAQEDATPAQVTGSTGSQTVQQGQPVTFNVTFTGTAPITFQWMKNGVDIPGAVSQSFVIPSANQTHEGSYTVRVMNPLNPSGAVSTPAVLQVDWPLSFVTSLPAASLGSQGDAMTFRVVMNGESPTYEWFKNDVVIPGANGSTYTINEVQPTDVATYKVRITGPFNPLPGLESSTSFTLSTGNALVLDQPQPATVLVGTDVVLTSRAGGDRNQRAVQWRRNGAQILGEDTDTLRLPGITLAQAGDYSFRVDNRVGTRATNATSQPAAVVVVENPGLVVAGQLGKTVRLTVNVGSPARIKPTFKWMKNGLEIPEKGFGGRYIGTETKTLTINLLQLTDADVFTCRVTGAAGTAPVVGGLQHLRVYDSTPVIVRTTPPPVGRVGAEYSWKVPVTSDLPADQENPVPGRAAPERYTATGLPPGLKINATTGVISGVPTAATRTAPGYAVTITVSNGVRTTPTQAAAARWQTVIDIKPLPAGVAGTYAGPVERSATLNTRMGGRFDMTVTTAGSLTGRLVLGATTLPFKGAFIMQVDPLTGDLTAPIAASIKIPATRTTPALSVDFNLGITAATVAGQPPVTILGGSPAVTAHAGTARQVSVPFAAWRNNFAMRAVDGVAMTASAYQGIYNFAFALPVGDALVANDGRVPQGSGYASMNVAAAGTYNLAGRTADGESLTGSAWVGPQGQCFVFQPLYTTTPKGSLLGQFEIIRGATPADNDIEGDVDWTRPANPRATHRVYKNGFGLPGTPVTTPVALELFGGRFLPPPATGTFFDLNPAVPGPVNFQAGLSFSEDRALSAPIAMDDPLNYNPNLTGIQVKARTVVTPLPASFASTRLSPVHTTGAFSGSFAIKDNNNLTRRSNFQGLMVRVRSIAGTDMVGLGYFILDQRPVGAERPNTTAQLSGLVQFQD